MTVHVTIPIESDKLDRARRAAIALGGSLEDYLHNLVRGHLPSESGPPDVDVSILFDFCESAEPTDVARDKDEMLGEADWKEHLRKTRQSS